MAIQSAQKVVELDSRNFQALATIGLLEMEASRYDKAIEYFRRCLSLNPWMGNISSLLSLCMSKVGSSVEQ
jgi:tetratricopeptide (TPR) repeat protein